MTWTQQLELLKGAEQNQALSLESKLLSGGWLKYIYMLYNPPRISSVICDMTVTL